MRSRKNFSWVLLSFALSACVGSAPLEPESDIDLESEEQALAVETSTDPSQATGITSFGACPGLYPSCFTCGSNSCGQPCCAHEREPGFEIWYEDECYAWTRPSWQRKNEPGLICHVDLDQHWNKVTIEVHVAEPYEDVSCVHFPDQWLKYEKDETSCSFFTSASECESRVEQEVLSVAAQGYIPTFTQPDVDQCPYPRM